MVGSPLISYSSSISSNLRAKRAEKTQTDVFSAPCSRSYRGDDEHRSELIACVDAQDRANNALLEPDY